MLAVGLVVDRVQGTLKRSQHKKKLVKLWKKKLGRNSVSSLALLSPSQTTRPGKMKPNGTQKNLVKPI